MDNSLIAIIIGAGLLYLALSNTLACGTCDWWNVLCQFGNWMCSAQLIFWKNIMLYAGLAFIGLGVLAMVWRR